MAEALDPRETVDFKELLIATMIEVQAIAEILFEKGIISQDEYVAKLKHVQTQYQQAET